MAQTLSDGTQVEACRAGKLEGSPDLTRQGCRAAGVNGTLEYWRCPASVVASQSTR
jgi:hypothetical protein